MTTRIAWIVAVALTLMFLGGVAWVYLDSHDSSEISILTATQEQTSGPGDIFTPIPLSLSLDSRKVELGGQLFNDPKLSGDGSVACAHCHSLATGGVDRMSHSLGVGGMEGGVNAPTVFNSGFNFRQFWDGRAETLEDQIDGPLQNPIEMDGTWQKALAAIAEDPQYVAEFKAIYRDGIQRHNVKDAIATFERSLITPNSRFDRFLRGDQAALNAEEQAGYILFKRIGCASCHQGLNIGGNMYQKLGIMEDYFAVRGHISAPDLGRLNITKREQDRYFFKVPSLRNVAVTPPYLHDGSIATLEEAVQVMARYQLGKKLRAAEVDKITAFLRTLTGEYSGKPLK